MYGPGATSAPVDPTNSGSPPNHQTLRLSVTGASNSAHMSTDDQRQSDGPQQGRAFMNEHQRNFLQQGSAQTVPPSASNSFVLPVKHSNVAKATGYSDNSVNFSEPSQRHPMASDAGHQLRQPGQDTAQHFSGFSHAHGIDSARLHSPTAQMQPEPIQAADQRTSQAFMNPFGDEFFGDPSPLNPFNEPDSSFCKVFDSPPSADSTFYNIFNAVASADSAVEYTPDSSNKTTGLDSHFPGLFGGSNARVPSKFKEPTRSERDHTYSLPKRSTVYPAGISAASHSPAGFMPPKTQEEEEDRQIAAAVRTSVSGQKAIVESTTSACWSSPAASKKTRHHGNSAVSHKTAEHFPVLPLRQNKARTGRRALIAQESRKGLGHIELLNSRKGTPTPAEDGSNRGHWQRASSGTQVHNKSELIHGDDSGGEAKGEFGLRRGSGHVKSTISFDHFGKDCGGIWKDYPSRNLQAQNYDRDYVDPFKSTKPHSSSEVEFLRSLITSSHTAGPSSNSESSTREAIHRIEVKLAEMAGQASRSNNGHLTNDRCDQTPGEVSKLEGLLARAVSTIEKQDARITELEASSEKDRCAIHDLFDRTDNIIMVVEQGKEYNRVMDSLRQLSNRIDSLKSHSQQDRGDVPVQPAINEEDQPRMNSENDQLIARFNASDKRLDEIEANYATTTYSDALTARIDTVNERLDKIEANDSTDGIHARLDTIDARLDQKNLTADDAKEFAKEFGFSATHIKDIKDRISKVESNTAAYGQKQDARIATLGQRVDKVDDYNQDQRTRFDGINERLNQVEDSHALGPNEEVFAQIDTIHKRLDKMEAKKPKKSKAPRLDWDDGGFGYGGEEPGKVDEDDLYYGRR